MIYYGLKLWTNNEDNFIEAQNLCKSSIFNFIELYYNPEKKISYKDISNLKSLTINIHAPNTHGFHEFDIRDDQLKIWHEVRNLADFLGSTFIILHPGKYNLFNHFYKNLKNIDDPRILIENMPGLDLLNEPMFGQKLEDLKKIHTLKPICFDIEKAIKAACYQKIDYKSFIEEALLNISPFYFHISGGDKDSPVDQHTNLWESNFDFKWIKKRLMKYSTKKDIYLVFETPKKKYLENDLSNLEFFNKI